MREVVENIWSWSRFSEEKGFNFNGTAVIEEKASVLIDPVPCDEEGMSVLRDLGPFKAIYLTNKDHERDALRFKELWNAPIWIHELDKDLLKTAPDHTFTDGQKLNAGIMVVHLPDQKSPGECAFHIQQMDALIVGDALIGHPAGKLKLLPAEKYADIEKAKAQLKRLLDFNFDSLMVGDGEAILGGAHAYLKNFLEKYAD